MTVYTSPGFADVSLLAAIVAIMALVPPAVAAEDGASGMQRVRSTDPAIATLIERAAERSATFRGLVADINKSNGIVYVHEGKCGRNVRACLLLSVTMAGSNRILHIKVDSRRAGNEVLGSIGHELRHAIEVLSDPNVTNDHAIYIFYQRVAPTDKDRFETEAAIQTGLDVLAEVRAWARRR